MNNRKSKNPTPEHPRTPPVLATKPGKKTMPLQAPGKKTMPLHAPDHSSHQKSTPTNKITKPNANHDKGTNGTQNKIQHKRQF